MLMRLECKGFRDTTAATKLGESVDYSTVRQWMKNCEKHKICSMRKGKSNWHPPRLLRISEQGRSARLLLSAHDELANSQEPYITLSHRWGEMQYTKLSRTNISTMQKEIHVSGLPQTFQDFFQIAWELGFPLVWIDSLCIMQYNDKEDWETQCKIMDKVYANAYLNVSATFAESDLSNMHHREQGVYLKPSIFGTSGWLMKQQRFILDGRAWIDEISEAPLSRRGWVFQERYLAQRVLHFGISQLAWECSELEALDTFPDGLPVALVPELLSKHDLIITLQSHASISPAKPEHGAYNLWRVLIERYSECSFTKQEDKLPALIGLSNFFAEFLNDTYIAGMWKESLPIDLAWYIGEDGPFAVARQTSSPSHYVPSWSWACVESQVQFPQLQFGIYAYHVRNINWSHSTENHTDKNTGIRLISLEGTPLPFRCDWKSRIPSRLTIGDKFTFVPDSFPGFPTAMHLQTSIADFQALSQVWFLPLLTTRYQMHGLLLRRSPKAADQYQRIGCVLLRVCEQPIDTEGPYAAAPPNTTPDSSSIQTVEQEHQRSPFVKWQDSRGIIWDVNTFYLFHHITKLRDEQSTIKIG